MHNFIRTEGVSYLQDQQNLPSEPKTDKPPYAGCLLACIALLYVTHLSLYPLVDVLGLFALAAFSVLYAIILATGDIRFTPLPPVVCALSLLARAAFGDGFTVHAAHGFANLIFVLLAALVLYACAVKKAQKSVMFAVLCAVYTVFLAEHVAFSVNAAYGSMSLAAFEKALDDFAAAISTLFQNALSGTASLAGVSAEEAASLGETLNLSVRLSLPTLVVNFSMIASALTLLLYKPIVRASHAEKDFLDGRNFRFSLSTVSVVMFYVSYFVYLIASFTASGSAVFVTFMNLSAILTYPFAWIGLRFLYTLLCAKLKSRAGSIALLAVVLPLAGMFLGLGGLLFTFLAFIGASSQLNANLRDKLNGMGA